MTTTSPASMGEPLSEADRLAEIQARLDAVVPAGPWEVFDNGGTTNIVGEGGDPYVAHIGNSSWPGTEEMAMFIANSPADIKFLLGLVRVLEGQLATAQEQLALVDEHIAYQHKLGRRISETDDQLEQQRLLGHAEARKALAYALAGSPPVDEEGINCDY